MTTQENIDRPGQYILCAVTVAPMTVCTRLGLVLGLGLVLVLGLGLGLVLGLSLMLLFLLVIG